MTPLPSSLAGGCQCGACRYEVSAAPLFAYVCHCLECRRQTGSAFAASVAVASDSLAATGSLGVWVRDTDAGSPLEATFCTVCGVRLFHHSIPHEPIARVRAGTLDDAGWFAPAAELFTKRRFDWLSVDGEPLQCPDKLEDYAAAYAVWTRLFGEQTA